MYIKIDFSRYSSLKIGKALEVKILDTQCLLKDNSSLEIVGGANNFLVVSKKDNLAILSKEFDYIKDLGDLVEIGAKTSSNKIFSFFKKNNLLGLECISNIPGQLGGLLRMNAGLKGYEVSNMLHSCFINNTWVDKKDLEFDYRILKNKGIIFKARFYKKEGFNSSLYKELLLKRSNQPKEPSCGSCFKNPKNHFAGKLLEDAKLKGFFINGVGFSSLHANFLINKRVSKQDLEQSALEVIQIAKNRVFEQTGIMLENEVQIL